MAPLFRRRLLLGSLAAGLLGTSTLAWAAAPSVEDALRLQPVQKDAAYDRPAAVDAAKCTLKAEKDGEATAWIVRNAGGQILRKFSDTNADNIVDQWSYYQDGIEVYRDIDANFNGKADQYRWCNTGGSRWGSDRNEDGRLDGWKQISAEEVTAEVVAAIANRDAARFERLLLTAEELKTLGVSAEMTRDLTAKLEAAPAAFAALAQQQKAITTKTEWVHFGATRPGTVLKGTSGLQKDLLVFENVAALVSTEGKDGQVQVGTLIRVAETWRLIDAPNVPTDGQANAADSRGYFFLLPTAKNEVREAGTGGPDQKTQQLLADLEKLDQKLAKAATPEEQATVHEERFKLFEQVIAGATTKEDRAQWVRQVADTVSAAVQSGNYPTGAARLLKFEEQLEKEPADKDLAGYVKFRCLLAENSLALQKEGADFAKVQEKWLKDLEQFVKDYPQISDTAEAMLQIAMTLEFKGEDDGAKTWYGRIAAEFPKAAAAKKAVGAKTRLESVGRVIKLQGKTLDGKTVKLDDYRGKFVVIQYWATWCEPCKADVAQLKELVSQYGAQGFAVLGVCLDNKREDAVEYVQRHRIPWQQVFEEGGLESPPANELGILTLPTLILVDKEGQVINRNVHSTELDRELKTRLK